MTVDGAQVMLSTVRMLATPEPSEGSLNFTASAHFDVANASCLFYTMLPHNVPEAEFPKFTVATIPATYLSSAMYYFSPPQSYNTSFCNLSTCNANEGKDSPRSASCACIKPCAQLCVRCTCCSE